MKKKQDWPQILSTHVEERLLQPYTWGVNDCVTYPADAIFAMTGEDPIIDIRGSWDSELAANQVLANLGGLVKAMDARFQRLSSPLLAHRGDVVMVKMDGKPSLGICVGAYLAAPGDVETLFISMAEARIAWGIEGVY